MEKRKIKSSKGIGPAHNGTYTSYYPRSGKTVIKSKPRRRKADEWSDKQRQARVRFNALSYFAFANKTAVINPIWNLSPENRHTGYSLFMKHNSKAFGAIGELTDASLVNVSNGSLPVPTNISIKKGEAKKTFDISWSQDEFNFKNQHEDTLVYALLVEDTMIEVNYTNIKREALCSSIEVKEDEDFNDYIYIFFTNKDRTAFSNSRALKME